MNPSFDNNCCGMYFVENYLNIEGESVEKLAKRIEEACQQGKVRKIVEYEEEFFDCDAGFEAGWGPGQFGMVMTFTDQQLTAYNQKLAKALRSIKKVRKGMRWRNPNTGNYITLFTYCNRPTKPAPYQWKRG